MFIIHIHETNQAIPSNMAFSILNNLLQNEVPIRHLCGGRGECGTCRMTILDGGKNLTTVQDIERNRLKAVKAGPAERLACQCHAKGDIVISIPVKDENR